MIRQLTGMVADTGAAFVVVDIGGVGYQVYTNTPTAWSIGTTISLFTHLAVRENALDLYGFTDRDTLEIFELLIELPKIGPKSALQILTQADILLLKEAVAQNDPSYLSKLSGIGKKSAEKIVAGLKDRFEAMGYTSTAPRQTVAAGTGAADTIDALIALGYPAHDARRVVLEITATDSSPAASAELIKVALRLLNQA